MKPTFPITLLFTFYFFSLSFLWPFTANTSLPPRRRLTHTVLFINAAAVLSNTVCDCLADAIILALYLHNHIIHSAQLGT
jgi:hypothetical protein